MADVPPGNTASGGNQTWPDLAGRLEGARHILPVRVYFEDTDFTGLAYHGSYVRWCERGRSDFLRLIGIHHHELADEDAEDPAVLVVRRINLDYLAPAHIDDVLEVITEVNELRTAYMWLDQTVTRAGRTIASARVQIVLVSKTGRPKRLTGRIGQAFASHAAQTKA